MIISMHTDMKMKYKYKNTSGFSMLEMSITLTIIALIVAAVLTGQSLKHRQELAQVITDISSITSAVEQFKSVYSNYYPGDLYNAADLLSSAVNGDGTGYLETSNTASKNEELLFWQHMVLAGLISNVSGSYDGTTVTGEGGVMVSPLGYGYFYAHKLVNIPSAAVNPTGKLVIQISKTGSAGLFTTKEAYDFDNKYDNTNPIGTSGTITAADGSDASANDCVTGGGAFNLTNVTGTPCILYFYIE